MRFSLKEEETGQYKEFVSQFLEQLAQINWKLSASLAEIFQQTQYKLLQDGIRQIVESYNERVANIVTQEAYQRWKESGMDLRGYLARYQVGEAAEEICGAVQGQIEEMLGIRLVIMLPEVGDPERPVMPDAEFERLKEIWNVYASEIGEACKEFLARLSVLAEENEIYNSLNGLMAFIYEGLGHLPEEAKQNLQKLKEKVDEISKGIEGTAEEWSRTGGRESKANIGYEEKAAAASGTLTEGTGGQGADTGAQTSACSAQKTSAVPGTESTEETKKPEKRESTVVERTVEAAGYMPSPGSGKEKLLDGLKKATGVAGIAAAGVVAGGAGLLAGTMAGGIAGVILGAGLISAGAKKGASDPQADVSGNDSKKGNDKNEKEKESEKTGKEENGGKAVVRDGNNPDAVENLTREEYREKYKDQILQVLIEIISPVGVDRLNELVERHQKLIDDSLHIHADRESPEKPRDNKEQQASQKRNSDRKGAYPYGCYTVNDASREWMGNEVYEMQRLMKPMEEFYKKRYRSVEDTKGYQTVKTVCGTLSTALVKYFLNAYDFKKTVMENCTSVLLQKVISENVPEIKDWQKDAVPHIQEGMKKLMPVIEENKILTRLKKTVMNTVHRYSVRSPLEGYLEAFVLEKYEMKLNKGYQDSGRYRYLHLELNRIKEEKDKEAVEYAAFASDIISFGSGYYRFEISASEHRKRREAGTGIFLNLVRAGLAEAGGMKADTANRYTDYFYEIYQEEEHINPRTELNPMERVIR